MTDGLTEAQQRAVDFFEGPLLVLAGPGSGKTRVITRRIVRLIEQGVAPWQILAITFTNRAAREMHDRVEKLLPGTRVWISTFHRFAAATLRKRANFVGLDSNFAIFDRSEQLAVIRHALGELDQDSVRVSPGKLAARISKIKNANTGPEEFLRTLDESIGEPFDQIVAQVYRKYQQLLMESNAVDFDDLLLLVVKLFSENPELRAEYDQRFRFLLVDEYQDTNSAQYQMVRALSIDHPNICAMGDPDQSVYGWRGADIQNILKFERHYPNSSIIRLEQNFRSTGLILAAADKLIAHNKMRKPKSLITDNEDGQPVRLHQFTDAKAEADGIATAISKYCKESGASFSDCAIVYRVNSMSRELELAFTRHRIPFQVAAGVAFYDRAEIKDVLCYLKLVDNPANQVAFQRIVNKPARGIGKKTQNAVLNWAEEHNLNMMDAARNADQIPAIKQNAAFKLKAFVRMMDAFSLANSGSVSDLLKTIVDKSGYVKVCAAGTSEQRITRESNIEELINAAAQYDEQHPDEPSVTDFLQTTSLVNDDDSLDPNAGTVTLMTMHAAKGTEYPVVFVIGLEHGIIPHERSIKSNDTKQLEEERRLLFVAMTRAMKQLHLTRAEVRAERGAPRMTIPSTFLRETIYETVDAHGEIVAPTRSFSERDQELRERLKQSMMSGDKPAIMSGAALLNGTQEEAAIPNTFAIGMRVRHPQHGMGTILDVSGFGKKRTVKVEFVKRTETIIVAHSPLQPVGMR
jgi:DNA helicase II / ATP-dependent DNA helicase PcrA